MSSNELKLFEDNRIRTAWDSEQEEWYFSVVDAVSVLSDSVDPSAYWRKLKQRLKEEGNETVTNCHRLKMKAADGKQRLTDVADTQQLLRIIQSIPSPKAEPFKLWLAQVGKERIDETIDPELTIDRALETYLKKGYSKEWINQRLQAIQVRKELTDEWDSRGVQKGVEYAILTNEISRAFSAKTDNRPEFQNMIQDSGKKLFDMIIVWKLDRFARNRYDSARYKSNLKKNGVKVVSATEVISDGAEGIILESVLEGYAEYYSADLSEKVIRGMTENALKCKFNGGTIPTGYYIDDDRHFQPDPLTAPFIGEAFQQYAEGATMTKIRDYLNAKGVRNTRGGEMQYNGVQHLLNNRRYMGEYQYRDVVVPDGIPAIVTKELFDRVQEQLAKNKKAPARHKAEDDYLLTTKLFCGCCGAYLCGESGKGRAKIYHYYKCVNAKKTKTCSKKPVKIEWIEDLVIQETMKLVMDDNTVEAIVSMVLDLQGRENINLPLYEQQLQEADRGIQNLLNAIQQGILTKSTKERLEELEAAKEELEIKVANEKLAKPRITPEFVTFWLHRFRKLDIRQLSHRKMLIDTFVNAIFLYDDKLVITFNHKEGDKTITLEDINTALNQSENGSDLDCSGAPKNRHPFRMSIFLRTRPPAGGLFRMEAEPSWFPSKPPLLPKLDDSCLFF